MATNDVKVCVVLDKSLLTKAMAAADELDESPGAEETRALETALAKLGEAAVANFVQEYRQGRTIKRG